MVEGVGDRHMKRHESHDLQAGTSTWPPRRFFTVAEANRALVLVKKIVDDITEEYSRLTELHEMSEVSTDSESSLGNEVRQQLVNSVTRIQGYVQELDEIGVDLKDWTLGVVHFPCMADGREVALCWESGETKVLHWHESDSEFTDRKPIDTLPIDHPMEVANS